MSNVPCLSCKLQKFPLSELKLNAEVILLYECRQDRAFRTGSTPWDLGFGSSNFTNIMTDVAVMQQAVCREG